MAPWSHLAAPSLAFVLATGALAEPTPPQAAVDVMAFELRQAASRQATRALGGRAPGTLDPAALQYPARVALGLAEVPPGLLPDFWPYSLSRNPLEGLGADETPSLPPLGASLVDPGPGLHRKKTDAPSEAPLERLTHLVNLLAGDTESRLPSYFHASQLREDQIDGVASTLAETFGGHPRKWRTSVGRATRSIRALVDSAWAEMEALIQDLPAQAQGSPEQAPLAERVASLQLKLERVDARGERLNLIRQALRTLTPLCPSPEASRDPDPQNPFPDGLRRRRI